jgi:SAM-dependent methyltransferase
MSLSSGERQVSPTIDGIRADHTARYKWVSEHIPPNSAVIDFACGIGYGTNIMAESGHEVAGYDIDVETLNYANKHYSHGNATFEQCDGNNPGQLSPADVAVSFETIEHIQDPRPLPNEAVMPWQREDGATTAFHFRHYTKIEFAELLAECGWNPVSWFGQEGPESDVEPDAHGRTLIAVCERVEIPEPRVSTECHIAILGLGPSLDQYLDITKRLGGRHAFCDQVWGINALGGVFDCDMVFHMDDVRIQEIRAAAKPASNIARMLDWIKTSRVPVVTSRPHPDYPATCAFPLEEVLNHLGHDYFNSTAAYAVAYAIHIGATKISVFGMDFTYPNSNDAEKGRGCVEFWLGQAHARGIEIKLPATTSLMDSNHPRAARLYGYDTLDVDFKMDGEGVLHLDFKERATLPTAEQIEESYDHSKPISEQHKSFK